jgi:hypothetical protein
MLGDKGKVHPSTALALDGGGQCHAPTALPMGKKPGTHCTGGCGYQAPVWTSAYVSVSQQHKLYYLYIWP